MHIQSFGYFGMQGILNVNRIIPNHLTILSLTYLADGDSIEIQNVYDIVHSYMIAKAIEGSITKKYIK